MNNKSSTWKDAWMDSMIKYITSEFKEAKGYRAKNTNAPAFSGTTTLRKATEDDEIIMMEEYMGKLLYFVTKLQPSMANAVRELSSHMVKPADTAGTLESLGTMCWILNGDTRQCETDLAQGKRTAINQLVV